MKVVSTKDYSMKELAQMAAQVIQSGGVIVYPTDTLYGLGADPTNLTAVQRLLNFKGNRKNKAISIAVKDKAMAQSYADLNETAENVYSLFMPGPVTVVSLLKEKNELVAGIASLNQTVGIRIIPHGFTQHFFTFAQRPMTATSANISGARSTRSLEDFLETTPPNKLEQIDLFIDVGKLPRKEASTVIDTSQDGFEIVRQGPIKLKQLNQIKEYASASAEQTQALASQLIVQLADSHASRPTVIALQGQLGAGKTVFSQGIAASLGIEEPLRSPTYTLVKEYDLSDMKHGLNKLHHIDAWRVSQQEELLDLGLEAMLQPQQLIILEWPQRLAELVNDLSEKSQFILVDIEVLGENERKIRVSQNQFA